jgi:hypothetical protein
MGSHQRASWSCDFERVLHRLLKPSEVTFQGSNIFGTSKLENAKKIRFEIFGSIVDESLTGVCDPKTLTDRAQILRGVF